MEGQRISWTAWKPATARQTLVERGVGLATFSGPTGFTQHPMKRYQAEAIAAALGINFEPEEEKDA